MKSKLKDKVITALVILLAVTLLVVIFLWFRWRMGDEVNTTTRSYLSKNVEALAGVFRTKMQDQMVMLESQTRYFRNVDMTDYNQMKETILSTKGIGTFRSIGVASASGATLNYNGKSAGNIFLQEYFQEAMLGKSVVSEKPIIDEHGDEVLAMAVPIKQRGNTVGVVYGTFTSQEIRKLLDMFRFDPLGSNILISEDGTILSTNASSKLVTEDMKNINELSSSIKVTESDDCQFFVFDARGAGYLLVLTPVGVHDWYFGTILPRTIMTDQIAKFSGLVLITIIAIALVFTLLTAYILISSRRNERVRKELDARARCDSLTQLLNKRTFEQDVETSIKGATDQDIFILCMLDIDDFKHVNDSLGHAAGDAVIVETANRLKLLFRANDLIGRVGGDEYSVFVRCRISEVKNAEHFIELCAPRIINYMRRPFFYEGGQTHISVSVGFSYWPDHGNSYQTLYEKADAALYEAKQGGKNRYAVYREK